MYELIFFDNLDNVLKQVVLNKEYELVFENEERKEQTFTVNKTCLDVLYIEYTDDNGTRHSQFLDDFKDYTEDYQKKLGEYLVGIRFDKTYPTDKTKHLLFIGRQYD